MTKVPICRVLVLAPQKAGAARVAELIQQRQQQQQSPSSSKDYMYEGVQMEFLPAVAVFHSYEDEHGQQVQYLASIDYYGPDATLDQPSSLLTFFDQDGTVALDDNHCLSTTDEKTPLFTGISAVVVVGAGLETSDHVAMLSSFFKTMSKKHISMAIIQPNPEYGSMKEELQAFRELGLEEKEEATRQGRLGPGKMAKVALELAHTVVTDRLCAVRRDAPTTPSRPPPPPLPAKESMEGPDQANEPNDRVPTKLHFIDPEKVRYACRRCRTLLFGEDDLEDPPHATARHNFSSRKLNHGSVSNRNGHSSSCQSHFLQSVRLPWTGDMSDAEGRLACPKCATKIGAWHWSGAQCSCGTWVVPAIQIPKSKVDEIMPFPTDLPLGTVDNTNAVHRQTL